MYRNAFHRDIGGPHANAFTQTGAGMGFTNNPYFSQLPRDYAPLWSDQGIDQPQGIPPPDVNDPGMQYWPEQLRPPVYQPGGQDYLMNAFYRLPQPPQELIGDRQYTLPQPPSSLLQSQPQPSFPQPPSSLVQPQPQPQPPSSLLQQFYDERRRRNANALYAQ